MNIVDYVVLALIAVSVVFGLYRGFMTSLLGLVCVFAAMFVAYAIGPTLATAICKNRTITDTLIHYTDASMRLGDLDLSLRGVAGLDAQTISGIVSRVNLPKPLDALLSSNLTGQAFAAVGGVSVADYINQTLVTATVSILCYVAIFFVAYLALTLIVNLLGYVLRFPQLKLLDTLLGGVFGLARGVFVAFVLFALVPVAMTILPFDGLGALVESSRLGSVLYNSNIVTTILQGHL